MIDFATDQALRIHSWWLKRKETIDGKKTLKNSNSPMFHFDTHFDIPCHVVVHCLDRGPALTICLAAFLLYQPLVRGRFKGGEISD